jgi:hypothetical protein
MHTISEHLSRQSSVIALFEDRALSFILAKGATLGELSDCLADLGRPQDGRPVAISVIFGASSRSQPDFGRASRDVM